MRSSRKSRAASLYSRLVDIVETRYAVPGWGAGELWESGAVVVAHDFRFGATGNGGAALRLRRARLALRGLSRRRGRDFDDVELDLEWATPFQRDVADALRAVPRGEVVTYGELAALAGYPGAARAAGSFCAANRFSFLVPCHRVVAAHGIGSYGRTGVEVKRRLLALEGVHL